MKDTSYTFMADDEHATSHVIKRLDASCIKRCDHPIWDYSMLSINPATTMAVVQSNLDKPWDWHWLSMNTSITLEILLANWETLSINKSLCRDFSNQAVGLEVAKHEPAMLVTTADEARIVKTVDGLHHEPIPSFLPA